MIELTLDNFEEIYRAYLLSMKHKRKVFCFTPSCFLMDVRNGTLIYKGNQIFTRIKSVEYDIDRMYQVADEVLGPNLIQA